MSVQKPDSQAARPSNVSPFVKAGDEPANLRERIATTVKAAQAKRAAELEQAADRAEAERRETQLKAKQALLLLLSDDTINAVIERHAGWGQVHAGTIKVTKQAVELVRSSGPGASHMAGDRLDIRFDGAVLQAGQQIKSPEFQNRVQELQGHGIKIEGVYDASGQCILISFDYAGVLG